MDESFYISGQMSSHACEIQCVSDEAKLTFYLGYSSNFIPITNFGCVCLGEMSAW